MPLVDFLVETETSQSTRAHQLESMFDVPPAAMSQVAWKFDAPIEANPWQIGLITGPSGSGKTQVAHRLFGDNMLGEPMEWSGPAVIDDFSAEQNIEDIAAVCQAVGFNTIPSWLRPYRVLSNGEQFRVALARALLDNVTQGGLLVMDEFTSVVDRQVAKIAAHAVQKYIRKDPARQFVAVTCHDDLVEWLQPDWVLDPSVGTLEWRSLQRRPELRGEIVRVHHRRWARFAPFHYLTAELSTAARCYELRIDDRPVAFAGMLYRPHPKRRNLYGLSRVVTLPDWQGMGLAYVLIDRLAAMFAACGMRFHMYPAHPALIHSTDRSRNWRMIKKPGTYSDTTSTTRDKAIADTWRYGRRPNAVFVWCGPVHPDRAEARAVLEL